MKLRVERTWRLPTRTVGRMFLAGGFETFTCEDRVRTGPKVYGETAIPCGTYQIKATYSSKFKRVMPEIIDVPGFSGIRIHAGNTEADSLGCIIVGDSKDASGVMDSKVAAKRVNAKIMAALTSGDEVSIEVVLAAG